MRVNVAVGGTCVPCFDEALISWLDPLPVNCGGTAAVAAISVALDYYVSTKSIEKAPHII